MSCVCVDVVMGGSTLCLCEMDIQPALVAESGLVSGYAGQLLIGLGKIITSHPDVKTQVEAHTGERLIELGKKLYNQASQ